MVEKFELPELTFSDRLWFKWQDFLDLFNRRTRQNKRLSKMLSSVNPHAGTEFEMIECLFIHHNAEEIKQLVDEMDEFLKEGKTLFIR